MVKVGNFASQALTDDYLRLGWQWLASLDEISGTPQLELPSFHYPPSGQWLDITIDQHLKPELELRILASHTKIIPR